MMGFVEEWNDGLGGCVELRVGWMIGMRGCMDEWSDGVRGCV